MQTRHLLIFLAVFVIPLGLVFVGTGISTQPYKSVPKFGQMTDDEFLGTNGMGERGRIRLKIEHAEKFGAPNVGLFGSHAVRFMTNQGGPNKTNEFTNFYVMHTGLPDTADLLRKLESTNSLPKKLILVQLHNPHTTNWEHIIFRLWELPWAYYMRFSDIEITDRVRTGLKFLGTQIQNRLDLRHFLYRIYRGPLLGCRPVNGVLKIADALNPESKRQVNILSHPVIGALDSGGMIVAPPRLYHPDCGALGGIKNDGSSFDPRLNLGQELTPENEPINRNPIAGRAGEIVALMRQINDIAGRNGRKAVFFVPPVYEIDRQSPQSKMLNGVLKSLEPEMLIIDHRLKFRDKKYYFTTLNPNHLYFQSLMNELKKSSLL